MSLLNESYLLFYHLPVDFASCDVVVLRERHIQIAFVIAKIEVGLTSIVKYKDLACL